MIRRIGADFSMPSQFVGQRSDHAHRRIGAKLGRRIAISRIGNTHAATAETAANFIRPRETFSFLTMTAVEMLDPPRAVVESFGF